MEIWHSSQYLQNRTICITSKSSDHWFSTLLLMNSQVCRSALVTCRPTRWLSCIQETCWSANNQLDSNGRHPRASFRGSAILYILFFPLSHVLNLGCCCCRLGQDTSEKNICESQWDFPVWIKVKCCESDIPIGRGENNISHLCGTNINGSQIGEMQHTKHMSLAQIPDVCDV